MYNVQQLWRRLDGQRIHQPIKNEIHQMLATEKESGYNLKVCIGTDSQVKGNKIEFATAIVFVRQGKGGFMYVSNETVTTKMAIKQRMLDDSGT